ncbi:DUF3192 domain-containing protein [Permianibacter sp. IMCC34836]|uniref:DUF3192 domain-containing protein n=1 Tax=Permianibacter fluminis TaxID=2738515 RepID=UPI001552DB5D|nr:DUF3192 domain-containing protein [Permianibacter fluminis]NQD37119.1 DUF3192 domain-containing protein [Permianibacter fluminis]
MKKTLLALSLAMATTLTGCVIAIGPDGFDTGDSVSRRDSKMREKIADLPLGQSTESVREKLGEPEFSEAFAGKDGEYRVWFYRTHRTKSDGDTSRDETTPLVFRDGKLVAFGEDAYRQALAR